MPYRYATENQDYSDYASGRFFYAAPGHPALPVRLGSEIFQRSLAHLRENGRNTPLTLYDPCCGSAYHLCTLTYLHWRNIGTIIASDIDPNIVAVAERNLNLLSSAGAKQRTNEILGMIERYGKTSHTAALESAHYFTRQLNDYTKLHRVETYTFTADATIPHQLTPHLVNQQIDLVFTDVPYGQRSSWQHNGEDPEPLTRILEGLRPFLSAVSVVAIVLNKSQSFSENNYRRIEKFQIGKRRVVLLQL
ncbi:MAG: hypothetical protein WAM60_19920 [Candidatus Promineifilaceae bacterium]